MNKQRTDLHILTASVTLEDGSTIIITAPVFLNDVKRIYTQEIAINGTAYDMDIAFGKDKTPASAKIYEYNSNDLIYEAEVTSFFPAPIKESHRVRTVFGNSLVNQLDNCDDLDLNKMSPKELEENCPEINDLLERKFSTKDEAEAYKLGLADGNGWDEYHFDSTYPEIPDWAWEKYGKHED